VSIALDESERRVVRHKARATTLDALQALGGEGRRDAIREWALARGGFTSREMAAPPPEGALEKYPSFVDYALSWALTNLKREGLVENPSWSIWRSTTVADAPAASAVDEPVDAGRLAELRAMQYRLYLRTPEWRRTRAAALVRAGNACSLDVSHTEGLEVHHRTYERLGEELVTDLTVLCHACHQLHHKAYGRPRKERSRASASPGVAAESFTAKLNAEKGQRRKPSLLRRLLDT
jgi:restriction endonuclease Mrr